METGIGEKIKQLRLEHDLTMDMLIADINGKFDLEKPMNKSMLSRWESGINDPSLENTKYLSIYFNVSVDWLIGLTDTRTPSRLLAMRKKTDE